MAKRLKTISIAGAVGAAVVTGLFWNDDITLGTRSSVISEAQAIIGRPLTA